MSAGPPLLVLHASGDLAGGAPWAEAFTAAGWPGHVLAPDLPGHAGAPPPLGGNYESGGAVFAVLPLLRKLADGPRPVVVGVGCTGWGAMIVALSGRAAGLVLVDGLGGPWSTPQEIIAGQRDILRAIADDPAAVAPPPPGDSDPRLLHTIGTLRNERLATRMAAGMPVPTLVLESPGSPLPATDRERLIGQFKAPVEVATVATARPSEVAPRVVAWLPGLD